MHKNNNTVINMVLNSTKPKTKRGLSHPLLAILSNQDGFILVMAILLLSILVIVGAATTNNTITELAISRNYSIQQSTFYAAESGWPVASAWINSQYPLPTRDMGIDTSGADITFTTANSGNPDSSDLFGNTSFTTEFTFDSATNAVGYSTDFKRFSYSITSIGSGRRNSTMTVTSGVGKIEHVGGY